MVEKRWEELIVALERDMQRSALDSALVPLKRTVLDYEVRRIRACRKAMEIARKVSDLHCAMEHSQGTRFELWLQSEDGLLGGFVDQVQETADGVILRDYKSGYIFDREKNNEPAVKEAYQAQLRIYAALYKSVSGRWPISLLITPLQGPDQLIAFHPSDCEALVKEATIRLKEINATIDNLSKLSIANASDSLATRSASVCRFCRFRPKCGAYQKARDKSFDSHWPADVWGTVTDIHALGNGRLSLSIQVENRPYSKVHIRGIEPTLEQSAVRQIHEGDRIAVYNLKGSASAEMYSEGSQTVVYQL